VNSERIELPRFLSGPRTRLITLSVLAGVAAGAAASALAGALHLGASLVIGRFVELGGAEALRPSAALLLLPALGGLLSGLAVQRLAGLPVQQGTDQMVLAFHRHDGVLPVRGTAIRAAAAVVVISFGGSAGPEGPIAGLGAGLGSWLGSALGLTARERRALLIAGCAAGVGAIFHCPLGGALFATSVLYRRPEFEGSALVPAFVASAVGYATFLSISGSSTTLFHDASSLEFASALELPVYVALGLACGGAAALFGASYRRVAAFFAARKRTPAWLRPALGGLAAGAVACALPQVMDGEYRMIQNALTGELFRGAGHGALLWAALLAAIVVAKCIATAFTVGSGGAGGVIGPSLFLGGAVGASLGILLQGTLPFVGTEGLREALIPVGMAGVLAASMRTPIAAMVMVVEMTGSFGLIVPLMLVVVTAYGVGRRYGLVAEQLPAPADSPTHAGDLLVALLERLRVEEVARSVWPAVVEPATPLAGIVASLPSGAPPTAIVVERGRVRGVISFAELRAVVDEAELVHIAIAADLMSPRFDRLAPDDSLYEALGVFARSGAEALPVTNEEGGLLGVLTRGDVHEAVSRRLAATREELLREHAGLSAIAEHGELAHLISGLPAGAGRVERVPVGAGWLGRTLREVDARRELGGLVLAVHTADKRFLCPPDPARPFTAGDRLVVLRPGATEPPVDPPRPELIEAPDRSR
jgi:CIC family chloride channel protein